MYQDVLFPTDGSDGAEVALEHTRDIAATYDATVHVLFVANTEHQLSHLVNPDGGDGQTGMVESSGVEVDTGLVHEADDPVAQIEAAGEQLVETTGDKLRDAGVNVTTAVRRGAPHRTITEYATDNDIDLTVMPTRGRQGVDRYLLGSVTEKVVRTADQPVMTVRMGD